MIPDQLKPHSSSSNYNTETKKGYQISTEKLTAHNILPAERVDFRCEWTILGTKYPLFALEPFICLSLDV